MRSIASTSILLNPKFTLPFQHLVLSASLPPCLLSVCLSLFCCFSVSLPICLFASLPPVFCLFVYLSVLLLLCLSFYLPISICFSVSSSDCLSVCFSLCRYELHRLGFSRLHRDVFTVFLICVGLQSPRKEDTAAVRIMQDM